MSFFLLISPQENAFEEIPIALAYLNGTFELFSDPAKGKSILEKKSEEFEDNYCNTVSNKKNNAVYLPPSSVIAGIRLNKKIYQDIRSNPLAYGPIYISATINKDGTITSKLHIYYFDCVKQVKNRNTTKSENVFSWHEAGSELFSCDTPLVKNFVEQEGKNSLIRFSNLSAHFRQ